MFCAALSAPVTMCTLASSRTPDMPIGIADAFLAVDDEFLRQHVQDALVGRESPRPWPRRSRARRRRRVTSRSRIATTPCELRLRTWLPAMPAYTEWISQPAISSASSTARWIDCTVDSMLTTTPFFRPREGCEPRPITSIAPSAPISPTSATTFEVPMSRPTIRFRSVRLAIRLPVLCMRSLAGAPAAPRQPMAKPLV